MFLRVLTVLAASTTGLAAASLIYYSLLQDNIIYRGSPRSILIGQLFSFAAILWFLIVVYQLHLNQFSALLISAIGMLITKLLWDIGDGLRYAGRIYRALTNLVQDSSIAENFILKAYDHRQTQDLRAVALTMFAPDSRQMAILEALLAKHEED